MKIGDTYGPYQLISELGRGGMGVVYRAHDARYDRDVALKVLLPELADSEEYRGRFLDESRRASQLSNPHVVTVHNFGELDGLLYLEMDLIPGRDLATVLADGPMAPVRAVRIVEQIAEALDAAHAVGLVHRDVKPANIMLRRRDGGRPDFAYLCDFGLVKPINASFHRTVSGTVIGTVDYMAPEQLAGHHVDPQTDVYALGCVLYHCLEGRPPFANSNIKAVMDGHERMPVPPLRGLGAAGPAFDRVLATAMAKNPPDRYRRAGDLAETAVQALEPHPVPYPGLETERQRRKRLERELQQRLAAEKEQRARFEQQQRARQEQARQEQARQEQARREHERQEQVRLAQVRAQQAQQEQVRLEQARAEQARAEHAWHVAAELAAQNDRNAAALMPQPPFRPGREDPLAEGAEGHTRPYVPPVVKASRPAWQRPAVVVAAIAVVLAAVAVVLFVGDRAKPAASGPAVTGSATSTSSSGSMLPAPANLRAAMSATGVELSWDPVSGADHYTVVRDAQTIEADDPTTGYHDTSATPGQKHVYSVSAVDSSGMGGNPARSVVTVTVPTISPTPTVTPTPTAALSSDETALVDSLPVGLVVPGSCVAAHDQEDPVYTEAGVRCRVSAAGSTVTVGAPTTVIAVLDRSPTLLAQDLVNVFKGDTFGTDFTNPPAKGGWAYGDDPTDTMVGTRWLLEDTSNVPRVYWSYDNASTLIGAYGGTSTATIWAWYQGLVRVPHLQSR